MTNWLDSVLADGEHAERMRNDLEYFARHALKLRPKAGPLEPFIFNAAQKKLHETIEAQRARTGRVRVVILKARQMGVSTYVAARLYQRTIGNPGLRTIILGHERRASSNLFGIVKRFHENLPDDIRPVAQAYFVVKGKQVVLTDSAGNTLRDPEGRDYAQEPIGTDTERETAGKLLKRFRTKLRGDRPSGFDHPLKYPPLKY